MNAEVLGIKIIREALLRTPEDTGYLKQCYEMSYEDIEDVNSLVIMNTCEYAPYVHEMMGNIHVIGEAKFLQHAVDYVLADTGYYGIVDIGKADISVRIRGRG